MTASLLSPPRPTAQNCKCAKSQGAREVAAATRALQAVSSHRRHWRKQKGNPTTARTLQGTATMSFALRKRRRSDQHSLHHTPSAAKRPAAIEQEMEGVLEF